MEKIGLFNRPEIMQMRKPENSSGHMKDKAFASTKPAYSVTEDTISRIQSSEYTIIITVRTTFLKVCLYYVNMRLERYGTQYVCTYVCMYSFMYVGVCDACVCMYVSMYYVNMRLEQYGTLYILYVCMHVCVLYVLHILLILLYVPTARAH